jgi:hypothetical protein
MVGLCLERFEHKKRSPVTLDTYIYFVNTCILYIETPRPNTNRHVHAHKCLHCAGIELTAPKQPSMNILSKRSNENHKSPGNGTTDMVGHQCSITCTTNGY